MEPHRDQLVRYALVNLRRAHGMVDSGHASDSVGVYEEVPSDDIDPDEVTEVLLHAAAFLGFLIVIAVGAAAVFALGALRQG